MTETLRTSTATAPMIADSTAGRSALGREFAAITPGLILVGGIAVLAFLLRRIPGMAIFSPMILATLLGMVFHNIVGTPVWAKPGVTFSLRRILRLGIILLGLQLMASQVAEVGLVGVGVILTTLVATFVFTKWLGRLIGADHKVAELIAAGTSICGASAVIATNTVTGGSDEDVAYAVACVTVFGSLSMFLYPLFPAFLHLNAQAFGLWSGSSIHEIAQVVAAAFQDGSTAGGGCYRSKIDTRHDARTAGDLTRVYRRPACRRPSRRQPRPGAADAVVRARLYCAYGGEQHRPHPAVRQGLDHSVHQSVVVDGACRHGTGNRLPQAQGRGVETAWSGGGILDFYRRIQSRPGEADVLFLTDDP